VLTDEIIEGVKQKARILFQKWGLKKYRVTEEEAESLAVFIAVKYTPLYDATKGRKFVNYLLQALDYELPRRCAREGLVMQAFHHPTTGGQNGSSKRTEWNLYGKRPQDFPLAFLHHEEHDGFDDLVEWCLSQLIRRSWQRVFYLRVVEGLTLREVGERIGVTHQAVTWTWDRKIIPALRRAAKCWY
jgi:hypothetical protein